MLTALTLQRFLPLRSCVRTAAAHARVLSIATTWFALAASSSPIPAAFADDIGPNKTNGTVTTPYGASETSGQPVALAGNSSRLYLVTLNAGVWRSINNGPWTQLPESPPRSYSIAIDPNDASHLVVGERDGDAVYITQNGAGVWESSNGGDSWTYSFDPLSVPGCYSQAIPSLTFAHTRTLFIAGPCGIGRRPADASGFDFTETPPGLGPITRIVASETKVWARTATQLLVSDTDGLSWTVIPIPSSLDGYTITFAVSPTADVFSLGAFDSGAYMTFKPHPDNVGNHNTIIIYNADTNTWLTQLLNSGDGTGCGGRRFVKSFVLDRNDLAPVVGQRLQLFVGAGQDVLQADGRNPDGTITSFTRVALTSGVCTGANIDPIHPDIWDFYLAPDNSKAWLADDGGVFSKSWPTGGWSTQDENLFTHYIYTLNVLLTDQPGHSRFAYATPDNDAWFYNHLTNKWKTFGALGDANWTAADAGNPKIAMLVRNPFGFADLTAFDDNLPNGQPFENMTLNNDTPIDGPQFLQFIQTLKDENPTYPLLDAVMLVFPPLHYRDGANLVAVPGVLGQPNASGAPVLIRNSQFAASPDANQSKFQTWQIVANDLPAGARGVWVSGGHADPTYYVYTHYFTGKHLYKHQASGGWSLLNVYGLLDGGTYGPAFVNPYDPNDLYVLTEGGVQVSTNGGNTFDSDFVLTSLVTASGKFPLTGSFNGGNGGQLPPYGQVPRYVGSRAVPMGTLSHMAFDRNNPGVIIAASPFTGVFFKSGTSPWDDVTTLLPRPLSAVAAVGLDDQYIYVATDGRGLLRLVRPDRCTIAPTITCPGNVTVECTGGGGVEDTDSQLLGFFTGVVATGPCDPNPIVTNDAPGVLHLGTNTVTFTATDRAGNSSQCSANVTVVDTQLPSITVSLHPGSLWPPNHQLAPVHADVQVSDVCDPHPAVRLISLTSDEPDNGRGDGDVPSDIQGASLNTADFDFVLRSERSGLGNGRHYVACYRVTDLSGNFSTACDTVFVPHDQKAGHAVLAVRSGAMMITVLGRKDTPVAAITGVEIGTAHLDRVPCSVAPVELMDTDGDGVTDAVYSFAPKDQARISRFISAGERLSAYWKVGGSTFVTDLDNKTLDASGVDLGRFGVSVRPNPVVGDAVFRYVLPADDYVRLSIFDLAGREVVRLVDKSTTAGLHEAHWSPAARNSRPQMYLYRLETPSHRVTGRFVVLR